jgi:hypothetical protein
MNELTEVLKIIWSNSYLDLAATAMPWKVYAGLASDMVINISRRRASLVGHQIGKNATQRRPRHRGAL